MKKFTVTAVMAIVLLGTIGTVQAEEFSTALSKTLSEMPDGADALSFGGATLAAPDFSSVNPAILAVETAETDSRFGTCADAGHISFRNGLRVKTGSVSGTVKLPVGFMQLQVSDARSNTGNVDEFSNIEFNNNPSVGLQYGLSVAKDLYVGLSYSNSQSKITSNVIMEDEETGEPYTLQLTSKSKGNEVGAGVLYRFCKANFGGYYARSWDKTREYVDDVLDGTDSSHTDQVRLGASVQLTSMTMVAVDWRHYWFPDSERDSQFFAGIEQYVVKDVLAIYGGYANGGATAGLGIYFEKGGLNLAYAHRPFRSTEKFLGKAEMFEALLYCNF